MSGTLFDDPRRDEQLGPGTMLLPGFALDHEAALLAALDAIVTEAPLRHMETPGGHRMSVAMTNCGAAGWLSDRRGYRYGVADPESARPWPAMPGAFRELATSAAARSGYPAFAPDACLVNCYVAGARMSLHQDGNERDLAAPIVSVSLGLSATFLWGGMLRAERPRRVPLHHGDVMVWGGVDRLRFHGVAPLADGEHPTLGARRINLTFRKTR